MHVLALTGGIASGKSMACQFLKQLVPGVVLFDCDQSVHRLLQNDPQVIAALIQEFGSTIQHSSGGIDRSLLRARAYDEPAARAKLEAILHKRVREECLDSLATAAKQGAACFIADVPLLFEKGFDFGQSQVILIAVSRSTQISRLRVRNGFDDRLIQSILAAQLPLQEKVSRADFVFWNEGPSTVLQSQLSRFVTAFS
jgi:dephospho-CoA kinase